MGKVPYITDSDGTEDTSSSVENVKKKKKFSILKYSNGNARKKKYKVHSRSEPDDSDCRSRSDQRVKYKPPGILKHRERESSDEDEDSEPLRPRSQDRCLVGRVPRPAGAKPGRGGGLAIIIKKNVSSRMQPQTSTNNAKRGRSSVKRLAKKRSY